MANDNSFQVLAARAGSGDLKAAASMLRLMRDWSRVVTSGVACPEIVAGYFGSIAAECDRAAEYCDGYADGLRAGPLQTPEIVDVPPPPDWGGRLS